MQTMQIHTYVASCYRQECSTNGVVVISSRSTHLRARNFTAHLAAGPGDHCAHFQRRAYYAAD